MESVPSSSAVPPFKHTYLTLAMLSILLAVISFTLMVATGFNRDTIFLPFCALGLIAAFVFSLASLASLLRAKTARSERLYVSLTSVACMMPPILTIVIAGHTNPEHDFHGWVHAQAHARGIAHSCQIYAADNNDAFPPHLSLLVLKGELHPKELLNPVGNTTEWIMPTPPPPESEWRTRAPVIDAHCDFTYIGADLHNFNDPDIIIAYTHAVAAQPEGRVVAFSDGHSEFVHNADLHAAFDKSNAARATHGLPAITLDASPPATAP